MARDAGRPPGYNPFLELYLRQQVEGGDVRDPGIFRGPLAARSRTSTLILVHGFNNNDGQAAIAYFGFRRRQEELSGASPDVFDAYFGDSFWPGDADYWWVLDMADFLVYPSAVKKTPRAAEQLGQLLISIGLQRVDFIAHSLGCRVVLETLLWFQEHNILVPRVERVCLMAAAVPAEMLQPHGRFYDLMTWLTALEAKVYVLHSKRDKVLFGAFPPGQQLAGEGSIHALGRDGPDESMPGYRSTLTNDAVPGADHSDYWGHVESTASRDATYKAGDFLNLAGTAREISTARPLGPPIEALDARRIGSLRRAFARIS